MFMNVSMCWDGVTETAELTIDGIPAIGRPNDITAIFHAVNDLLNKHNNLERRLNAVKAAVENVNAYF